MEEADRQAEMDNIKTALRQCCYPDWAFKAVETKLQEEKTKKRMKEEKKGNAESLSVTLLVLPYVKGLSETRVMKKYGRTCAFKLKNTLGQQLFRLKDKADSMKMADVIYKVQCKDCPSSYIRETSRQLDLRLKRAPFQ